MEAERNPPRILFVDDEPLMLSGIKRAVEATEEDWNLYFARSAAEAIHLCRQQRFDLIVTDARMPAMEGSELIRRLREASHTQDIPTLMLTGHTDAATMAMAREAGVREVLDKPISGNNLCARMRLHLGLS